MTARGWARTSAVAAGAAMLCLCWRRLLLQGQVPVDGNMIAVTFPNWALARELWRGPALPLWNPGRDFGVPYLADPVASALYPPMPLFAFAGRFIDFLRAWVVFHTLLASTAFGALAWRRYRSLSSAAVAALVGGFN